MTTLDQAQRARLIEAHAKTTRDLEKLEDAGDDGGGDEAIARVNALADRIQWIEETYEQALPRAALSRCPFTNQVAAHSFDPLGLDGLWWQYHHPIRPDSEPAAGPHFLALTGAVRLVPPLENTPFLVMPGPDAPFVVPRVLMLPQVKAVISLTAVGQHRAAAIMYFGTTTLDEVRPPTLWGTKWSSMDISERPPEDEEETDGEEDYDFELAPWIQSGKLLWIAPGDASLALRSGTAGCPYLQVPGARKLQMMQFGESWTADDEDDE